jgi:hopanoid biosynthesis associated protein HpnK
MWRLIVNADDFGYTPGVNAGVIQGFRDGIITSATVMANGSAFDDAIHLAQANPELGVGCHLVLVGGNSVAPARQVASLLGADGRLPASLTIFMAKLIGGRILNEHIANELRAQIERLGKAGIVPTHLDSHKHTHSHPRVMEVVAQVAGEFGIRRIRMPFENFNSLLRPSYGIGFSSWKQRATAIIGHAGARRFRRIARDMKMPDHFWGVAATGRLNPKAIVAMIESMQNGTHELMCHPGHYDSQLASSSTRLKRERELELTALLDPTVKKAVADSGIELTDFRGLDSTDA